MTSTSIRFAALAALLISVAANSRAQPSPELQERTAADHRQMMEQLGIKALRPAPSGR